MKTRPEPNRHEPLSRIPDFTSRPSPSSRPASTFVIEIADPRPVEEGLSEANFSIEVFPMVDRQPVSLQVSDLIMFELLTW